MRPPGRGESFEPQGHGSPVKRPRQRSRAAGQPRRERQLFFAAGIDGVCTGFPDLAAEQRLAAARAA